MAAVTVDYRQAGVTDWESEAVTLPASEADVTPALGGAYDVRVVLTNDRGIKTATETRRVHVKGDAETFSTLLLKLIMV